MGRVLFSFLFSLVRIYIVLELRLLTSLLLTHLSRTVTPLHCRFKLQVRYEARGSEKVKLSYLTMISVEMYILAFAKTIHPSLGADMHSA